MKKEMATHSSVLAWKIPWTEEPGGLQSMPSQESDTTANKPPPATEKQNVGHLLKECWEIVTVVM